MQMASTLENQDFKQVLLSFFIVQMRQQGALGTRLR